MNNRDISFIATMLVVIVVAFAWVQNADYDDAQKEEAYHCEMIRLHYWPDYDGNYRVICKDRRRPAP